MQNNIDSNAIELLLVMLLGNKLPKIDAFHSNRTEPLEEP